MHPVGQKSMTSPSTLQQREEVVPFELKLIGKSMDWTVVIQELWIF